MRRSHQPTSAGRSAPRLWAARCAALLAVFLQVFVVQAHVHAQPRIAAAGYGRAANDAAAVASETSAHHAQAACVLCQAQAGARALPPSAEAIVLAGAALGDPPSVEVGRIALERGFSWQSRAPPAVL